MTIPFYKYQGTGNDFILIDNRKSLIDSKNQKLIYDMCNRHFGIGADGLMLLQNKKGFDFEMIYFNADGKPGSMCGNGGRCIVAFAKDLKIINKTAHFIAVDGEHHATITKKIISLKMIDVKSVEKGKDYFYLNTGSPHYIKYINNIDTIDAFSEGRKIRYNKRFKNEGTNVNFVQETNKGLIVKTYERGVEAETFSCGTGVTAAALSFALRTNKKLKNCNVKTLGGNLNVKFTHKGKNIFTNIWLEGPASFVFKGTYSNG